MREFAKKIFVSTNVYEIIATYFSCDNREREMELYLSYIRGGVSLIARYFSEIIQILLYIRVERI